MNNINKEQKQQEEALTGILQEKNSALYWAITQQRAFRGSVAPLKKEVWGNLVHFQNSLATAQGKFHQRENSLVASLKNLLVAGRQVWLKPAAITLGAMAVLASALWMFPTQSQRHELSHIKALESSLQTEEILRQSAIPLNEKKAMIVTSHDFRGEFAQGEKLNFITIQQGKFSFSASQKLDKPLAIVAGQRAVVITGTTLSVQFDSKSSTVRWQLLEGKIDVYHAQLQNGKIIFSAKKQFDFAHSAQSSDQLGGDQIDQTSFHVNQELWSMFVSVNKENSEKIAQIKQNLQSHNVDVQTTIQVQSLTRNDSTLNKLELAPAKPMFRFTTVDGRVIVAELLTQNDSEYQVLLHDKKATLKKSEIVQAEEL